MLMPQNHLQFILEVAIFIQVGAILFFNVITIPLSMVLFLSLILTTILAVLFGIDASFLLLPFFSQHEFTHPFGPLAVFGWVTLIASANLLSEVEIKSSSIKAYAIILFIVIGIAGSLMHRSFLLLWIIGFVVSMLIMGKSFRRSFKITPKRIAGVILATIAGFGVLELLSRILNYPVLSPLLRLTRLEEYALPSVKNVINSTTIWGHQPTASFWGAANSLGSSDGYVTLPMSLINLFTLPFPLFSGVLVTKKDLIDYMLPGIFGWAFDFGYGVMILLLLWCLFVIISGFYILRIYRTKRHNGSRRYLGREALLIGALTGFIAQAIVGLFIFNRTINGFALVTFLFLSGMVIAHIVTVKARV